MSAAHTRGPWWPAVTSIFTSGFVDSPTGAVCTMTAQTERVANARLIAAAPDMLAALEAMDLARHTDAPADWQRATDLSDAAIAKALGRTPIEIGDPS